MFSNTLLIIILVNFLSDYSYAQRNKKLFRKDYSYIKSLESFFKIHTLQKNWSDAKRTCALEGASLFYPKNDKEAYAVISYWNATQPFRSVFIGISDLLTEGVFETIDGYPVSEVYHNWGPGEPNDAGGAEDCVTLIQDGNLNDERCSDKKPFICKKSLFALEWNEQCNMPDLDYIYNEAIGRCYNFHMTPLAWTDAYAVCSAEQSYLTVINTQLEADYLVKLMETATKDKFSGNYFRGAVHIGFHNRAIEGWQTVRGTSLDASGYVRWANKQPDGGDQERCGSMFTYNGHLNDIGCDTKCFFICEHEVDTFGARIGDQFRDAGVYATVAY